ncbi:MAG: diacylglycerol kinase family protein [Gaiellaceae bacterium]
MLLNPRSGGRDRADELTEAASGRGIRVRELAQGEEAAVVAREAEASALGMAGGDGSLAAVAEVAIERGLPFVCVPLGTRNHFARDLGLDRDDPVAALAAFDGEERRVDVGRVGDRLFLNNVALGVYAQLVHRREAHRRRRAALASLRALVLLARLRRTQRLEVDGEPVDAPVVLVASNAYELDLFNVGERKRLDDGHLHLYLAHGWLPRTWEERTGERFTVDAPSGHVRAAVDGEPELLETPLRFELQPRTLRVLVPRAPG